MVISNLDGIANVSARKDGGQDRGAAPYSGTARRVLVVEDDENDVFFFERAWREAGIRHPLVVCADGEEAMAYLASSSERGKGPGPQRPCVIITDLKMPCANGFELLKFLRREPSVADIPAVVLTSSNESSDRTKAAQLGARDYFVKPNGLQDLVVMLREIREKWIRRHCGV